jgi:hypothetical protein
MTREEMMGMAGVEFDYIFEDGDKIRSYVKLVDVDNCRLSLWSLGLVTEAGFEFKPSNVEETEEQALCVAFADERDRLEFKLKTIRDTGEWGRDNIKRRGLDFGSFAGCPF